MGKRIAKGKRFYLIASDMDRTIMPNGEQEADPNAIDDFKKLLRVHGNILLAYMTGRHLELAEDAIKEYELPIPDLIVGDVGTTIYERTGNTWKKDPGWRKMISKGWKNYSRKYIGKLLSDIRELEEQEPEKLTEFKQSYYLHLDVDRDRIVKMINNRLQDKGINSQIIYSIDEIKNVGLLDILPNDAAKDSALRYLEKKFYPYIKGNHILFAGDSGNDILALTAGYNAVLVNNAINTVKREVRSLARKMKLEDRIYFASGSYDCGQGNYTSGVIEGAFHFGIFKTNIKGEIQDE
jgi:sucrose-6F-phosphate phosphohydrolase